MPQKARKQPVVPDWAATPQAVMDAADRWSNEIRECRLNRHHWPGRQSVTHYPKQHYYELRQDCGRKCGVYRTNEMDEQGYLLDKWHPHYPTGYLLRGVGRMGIDGTAALRLDQMLSTVKVKEVNE